MFHFVIIISKVHFSLSRLIVRSSSRRAKYEIIISNLYEIRYKCWLEQFICMLSTCLDIVIIFYVEIIDFPCIHRSSMILATLENLPLKPNVLLMSFHAFCVCSSSRKYKFRLSYSTVFLAYSLARLMSNAPIFLRSENSQSAHRQRFCLVLI